VTARRPLAGRSVLVTRPRAQSRALCERLRGLGARAVVVPTIEIMPPAPGGPLDQALRRLKQYDWVIVTSANGARTCVARARALRVDLRRVRPRWAVIGPATAAVLRRAGIDVAMTPSRYLTKAIAATLTKINGRRVLLPRADIAPPELSKALRRRGAIVDEIAAYRTVVGPPRAAPRIRRVFESGSVDTVLFTSASTVRGLIRLLGKGRGALDGVTIACIGPVTADAVVEAGLRPAVVAREHTVEGLINALLMAPRAHTIRRKGGTEHAKNRAAR
jgi:uroporphyrinogen III methyltransferase/synthase